MNIHRLIEFYFECLNDAGEQMTFDLIKTRSGQTETLTFNHLNYDGVSALCGHLPTLSGQVKLPQLQYQPPPSFFKRIWFAIRWWYSVSYRPFFRPQGSSKEGFIFSSRVLKVTDESNLNARILWALHQALQTSKRTLWMLPVSLHEQVELGMKPENNVSFIDVKISDSDTPASLRRTISKELKQGSYWGTIYSMLIPRLMGKRLFIKVFPYFTLVLRRTGTFTNLGKWEISILPENESWGIRATVVPLNPLGASALQINDNLTIGLQLHPCLGVSSSELESILSRWQAALVSRSNS